MTDYKYVERPPGRFRQLQVASGSNEFEVCQHDKDNHYLNVTKYRVDFLFLLLAYHYDAVNYEGWILILK